MTELEVSLHFLMIEVRIVLSLACCACASWRFLANSIIVAFVSMHKFHAGSHALELFS